MPACMSRSAQCGEEFAPFGEIVFSHITKNGMIVYMKMSRWLIFMHLCRQPVEIPCIVFDQKLFFIEIERIITFAIIGLGRFLLFPVVKHLLGKRFVQWSDT